MSHKLRSERKNKQQQQDGLVLCIVVYLELVTHFRTEHLSICSSIYNKSNEKTGHLRMKVLIMALLGWTHFFCLWCCKGGISFSFFFYSNIHYSVSFFSLGTVFSPQSGMQSDIQAFVANIYCSQLRFPLCVGLCCSQATNTHLCLFLLFCCCCCCCVVWKRERFHSFITKQVKNLLISHWFKQTECTTIRT